MIHAAIIRTLLAALLSLQMASPEATQHWDAARRAEEQKHFDVAVREYRVVTELEPTFAAGFVSLGQALMEQRDYGSALVPLKRALEIDSNLAPAHQLLGYALLAQGYAAEAIPHLARVHEEGALGIAQVETGQFSEAIQNLRPLCRKGRMIRTCSIIWVARQAFSQNNRLMLSWRPIRILPGLISPWPKTILCCGKWLKPKKNTNRR